MEGGLDVLIKMYALTHWQKHVFGSSKILGDLDLNLQSGS